MGACVGGGRRWMDVGGGGSAPGACVGAAATTLSTLMWLGAGGANVPALNDMLTPYGVAFDAGEWGAAADADSDAALCCCCAVASAACGVCVCSHQTSHPPAPPTLSFPHFPISTTSAAAAGALDIEVSVPGLQGGAGWHMASGVPIKAMPAGAWLHHAAPKPKEGVCVG